MTAPTTPASTAKSAAHILVVDDDDRLRALLKRFLSEKGYRVTAAGDALQARQLLATLDFDLLVLDVMMPGETGLQLTAALRATSGVPILLLTARGLPEDRIDGLRRGADDYLGKPFEPEELVLRIDAILRRAASAPGKPERIASVVFGSCRFDLGRGELTRDGAIVRLTTTEAALLSALAERPGAVISRTELSVRTTGGQERAVDVQVTRLRRKIEADSREPIYLQTVRGIGYKLAAAPEDAAG